jgi:alpha-L-rhamnosidase
MRDVAAVLDRADDRLLYAREYDRIRSAYNKAWYDPVRKSYHPVSQANLAMPLAFGIVPDGDEAAVAAALADDIARPQETSGKGSYGGAGEFGPVLPYHISSGDIATTFVWRALGDAEQANLVQTMIMQDSTPGYMNMLEHGCTTIPENWDVAHTRSHNHDMYAGIFEWFYRSLAGISGLKPGYQEILIKPTPPQGLKSVSASCSTVRGIVSSSWSVEGRHFHLKVEIPANTTAKVYIPAEGKGMVKEGGIPMAEAPGITFLRMENGYAVLAVGSGIYSFDSIRGR